MEYDARKKLIDELAREMTGNTDEKEAAQLITQFDSATNTLNFILSGTQYNIEDMQKAKKYLQQKLANHPGANSERKVYYEIAITCIDTVIRQFTQPIDEIINSTKARQGS